MLAYSFEMEKIMESERFCVGIEHTFGRDSMGRGGPEIFLHIHKNDAKNEGDRKRGETGETIVSGVPF